jgi:hypothetical protein
MKINNLNVTSTFQELAKNVGMKLVNGIKEKSARITSFLLALAMTSSFALAKPTNANAEEMRKPAAQTYTLSDTEFDSFCLSRLSKGERTYRADTITTPNNEVETVVENDGPIEITDITIYHMYTVENGDNLSRISQKICRLFGHKGETKFWPVLAYLNHYPRVIHAGEIIFYPESYEEMERLLASPKIQK